MKTKTHFINFLSKISDVWIYLFKFEAKKSVILKKIAIYR